MTSPALVWVARFELAISRFRTERSRQVEPHPDDHRFRRCGGSRTFARGLMRPGVLRGAQRSGDPESHAEAPPPGVEPGQGASDARAWVRQVGGNAL